jgi:hypothetical protein
MTFKNVILSKSFESKAKGLSDEGANENEHSDKSSPQSSLETCLKPWTTLIRMGLFAYLAVLKVVGWDIFMETVIKNYH